MSEENVKIFQDGRFSVLSITATLRGSQVVPRRSSSILHERAPGGGSRVPDATGRRGEAGWLDKLEVVLPLDVCTTAPGEGCSRPSLTPCLRGSSQSCHPSGVEVELIRSTSSCATDGILSGRSF